MMPIEEWDAYDKEHDISESAVAFAGIAEALPFGKRPRMILFDYGGTLLCEPGIDLLQGEKEVFRHVVSNPHGYTAGQLDTWETERYQALQAVRDLDAELSELQLLRLKYELHGLLEKSYKRGAA